MGREIAASNDITEEQLMQEFVRIVSLSEKKADELTARDFAKYANVHQRRAQYLLNKYTEKKILKMRKIVLNGSSTNAYSPYKGSWKSVVEAIKNEE